jgi:hypothetical protein
LRELFEHRHSGGSLSFCLPGYLPIVSVLDVHTDFPLHLSINLSAARLLSFSSLCKKRAKGLGAKVLAKMGPLVAGHHPHHTGVNALFLSTMQSAPPCCNL